MPGAVLLAKLSLGALALNDIWFGGQTMNPWLLEEGASGSSAGPGAATAAGLGGVLDRERDGRQHRCAGDALRGHRPASDVRPGAAHGRDDAVLVARQARPDDAQRRGRDARPAGDHRSDAGDVASVPSRLDFDATGSVSGLRIGYFPAWMNEAPSTEVDRSALETAKTLGMVPTAVTFPNWPQSALMPVLFAEAAAAFEELTLSGQDDQLKGAGAGRVAEPLRETRFLSAVDFVQAGSPAAEVRDGDGADHVLGGSVARAVAA
jgi:Asp-tRNA(Asn)/Glu-tRNA(Gln) amidotransferase A subunit family amidase